MAGILTDPVVIAAVIGGLATFLGPVVDSFWGTRVESVRVLRVLPVTQPADGRTWAEAPTEHFTSCDTAAG